MKDKYNKLKALVLAGTIAITSSTFSGCQVKENEETIVQESIVQEETRLFGVGEHIISIPINEDIRCGTFQHNYYPGYEPIGISLTSYGKTTYNYGGGAILYSNTEEVECKSILKNENGNYLYLDFGTPIYSDERGNNSNDNIKEFEIGQHIISVPIRKDNRDDNFQYEYHDGYEIVGIATTATGGANNTYTGGVLLYKNIEPVKCSIEDGEYTHFGVPFDSEKVKKLK